MEKPGIKRGTDKQIRRRKIIKYDESVKIWERQDGETEKSYAYFRSYIEVRATRSYNALATKLGITPATIRNLSSQNSWPGRAREYDREMRAIQDAANAAALSRESEAIATARIRREETHDEDVWELRSQLVEKARAMLATPIHKQQRIETAEGVVIVMEPTDKWKIRDACAFIETADKLARLVLGKPTDRCAITIDDGFDVRSLTDEQLDKLTAGEPLSAVFTPEQMRFVRVS
jgi:hypothetical protein